MLQKMAPVKVAVKAAVKKPKSAGDPEKQFTIAEKRIEARYADLFSAPYWKWIQERDGCFRWRIVSTTPLRFLT